MKKISYSSVNNFHKCPYSYHLDKVAKIKKRHKSRALYIGSTIHDLLETMNRGEDWQAKLYQMEDDLTQEVKLNIQEESLLWIEDNLKAYQDCFKGQDYEVVELEKEIKCKIAGMQFTGYVDGLVKMEGDYYILERKTSSANFPERFNLLIREQPYIYAFLLEKMMGIKVKGIIWEFVTSKPLSKIRLKKDGLLYANSLKATPYVWMLEFGNLDNAPDTLSYKNICERTIIEIDRNHLNRMMKNFVERAIQVNTEVTHKNYDGMTCTRMCEYKDWCQYEVMGLDARALIGSVYDEELEEEDGV